MKARTDGGPAFPQNPGSQIEGLSLRDYFAALAMQAMARDGLRGDEGWDSVACYAYELADFMLAAREKDGDE